MCYDFGFLVSDNVWELKNLKEKARDLKEPDVLVRGLLCESKQRIVDTYTTACSNIMVFMGSLSQLLSIVESIDDLDDRIANTKKIFRQYVNTEIINEIQKNEHCLGCPRTATLFGIMQTQLEDVLFEEIRSAMIPCIGSNGADNYNTCEKTLDEIYDFAESALLHLSGLRINCEFLTDDIYNDERSNIKSTQITKLLPDFKNQPYIPPSSCIFGGNTTKIECLHIFLHDRFFKIKKWFDVYINLYSTYHKYPKRINVVLDYQLIDKRDFAEEDYIRYKRMQNMFGSVCIINSDHIDFGDFKDLVHISCAENIEECEG